MAAVSDEMACPVLRKLVALLELRREGTAEHAPQAFQTRLAEIELDALMLNAAPTTRTLIQVTRDVMTFADRLARPTGRA